MTAPQIFPFPCTLALRNLLDGYEASNTPPLDKRYSRLQLLVSPLTYDAVRAVLRQLYQPFSINTLSFGSTPEWHPTPRQGETPPPCYHESVLAGCWVYIADDYHFICHNNKTTLCCFLIKQQKLLVIRRYPCCYGKRKNAVNGVIHPMPGVEEITAWWR